MIRIENISKCFGERKVIDNISFEFFKGKTNLIIGESGCGKTVLLKMMVGLLVPDTGNVYYDGVDFHALDEKGKQTVRAKIGMLFQGGALFDSMTVEENVMFPLDMYTDWTKEKKLERVNFCLQRVKLEGRNHLYPAELSGGMKKRCALARAIANNPEYLFCDEPNSGLDPKTSIVIDQLIQDLTREFNMTTIIVTHDMNSVMEIGENIMFIHKGKKWWEGHSNKVLNSGNKELMDFVFASEFLKKVFHTS
ncbi:MAG: ATP-binding cassette domain-containing protein [Bacteroidia bacterium]|nr:ATP-binding cassette domain-containing protein [Bacteroidia bacterium]